MAKECMECRKWEEEMYWSHFQTVQFCQVLTRRFDQHLTIPKKFTNNLREKMAGTIALRGPSGNVWNVGLVTNGDALLLEHGWKAFVEDHSLVENDILIFKYRGDSKFDVLMFERETMCEKAASYFVRKCEHAESGARSKRRSSVVESPQDTGEASDDIAEDHQVKRSRSSDAARIPSPRTQPTTRFSPKGLRATKRGKRSSEGVSVLERKTRRRVVTKEEKESAHQNAISELKKASPENSFIVIMRPSHVYRGFYMTIPASWARVHLPEKTREVELRVGENTWRAKYQIRGTNSGLTGGWKTFLFEIFLEADDVCLFELLRGTPDNIIFDVKIFRVVQQVMPPIVVRRANSRRRLMKQQRDTSSEEEYEEVEEEEEEE